MAFDRGSFETALAEYRFDDADRLLAQAPPDTVEMLSSVLEHRRTEAEELGRSRYQRILDLGASGSYGELLEICSDPTTTRLMALLTQAERDRVSLHLRGAERWAESKRETNRRRLGEARRALDGLDLQLARGLIARVDGRYLEPDDVEERDELLLDVSARSMELEELDQLDTQMKADQKPRRRLPWRRRKGPQG